jgi:hypothetical protein
MLCELLESASWLHDAVCVHLDSIPGQEKDSWLWGSYAALINRLGENKVLRGDATLSLASVKEVKQLLSV